MRLALATSFFKVIEQHVLDAFPAESCGLLTGSVEENQFYQVHRIWPATNVLAHLPGRFELDPKCRFLAEKACRANRQTVIGHWHSHPNAPALPSETDRQNAFEPNLVWLILSTDGQSITQSKAFLSPRDQLSLFLPMDLVLLPETPCNPVNHTP